MTKSIERKSTERPAQEAAEEGEQQTPKSRTLEELIALAKKLEPSPDELEALGKKIEKARKPK